MAKFNSATIPPINKDTFAKYLTVGYYKNPRDNSFDVSKASIKIKRDSLPFLNCIKHIEVSGTSKKQNVIQKSSTSSTPSSINPPGSNLLSRSSLILTGSSLLQPMSFSSSRRNKLKALDRSLMVALELISKP